MNIDLEFVQSHMKLHLDLNAYLLAIEAIKTNDVTLHGEPISGDLKAELLRLLEIEFKNIENRLSELKNNVSR
jgi:hypothetical protein